MRKGICVPMMTLCLLAAACGAKDSGAAGAESARALYREMTACTMEAEVSCTGAAGEALSYTLRCRYVPEGETTVEVLAPETVAGVRAVLDGKTFALTYEDACLNVGLLSSQDLSPAACLPRLMHALAQGWLLEENREQRSETACLRLCMDESGAQGGKLYSTVWLREEDGTPLYGEIAVDGEIIFRAEFTSFAFDAILDEAGASSQT